MLPLKESSTHAKTTKKGTPRFNKGWGGGLLKKEKKRGIIPPKVCLLEPEIKFLLERKRNYHKRQVSAIVREGWFVALLVIKERKEYTGGSRKRGVTQPERGRSKLGKKGSVFALLAKRGASPRQRGGKRNAGDLKSPSEHTREEGGGLSGKTGR